MDNDNVPRHVARGATICCCGCSCGFSSGTTTFATQMLTNTMFLWTRLFASQLASTASRTATTRYAHLHRYAPLALSFRRFSTGNPTILAAAATAKKKPVRSSSPARKSTRKVNVKATKKAKTASTKKSEGRTKEKSKARKVTAPKKAPSTRKSLRLFD